MSAPATETAATNWSGVSYGIVLGFVAAYFQFKVPPVLPVMLDFYAYDKIVAGGFMSIFAVAGMVVSVRVGVAIRRHGAKRYLIGAFALLVLGSLLGLALPESGAAMLISRTIEGVGAAVLAVCMPAFANMNAGSRHLPLIIAMQATWIPVGQVSANLIAQPAVAIGQWQPVWWAGIAATAAVAIWTVFIVRGNSVSLTRDKEDKTTNDFTTDSEQTAVEKRALFVAAILFFLWQAQFMAYFTWLPVYLVEARNIAADDAVLINQIPVVILLTFALIAGFILRTGIGAVPMLSCALALQAASWLLVPVADYLVLGIVSLVAWGIAAGISPTCLWALPSVLLGGHRADTHAFAVVLTGRYLGILVGPLAAAGLFKITGDWLVVAYAFGLLTAAAVMVSVFFGAMVRRLSAA